MKTSTFRILPFLFGLVLAAALSGCMTHTRAVIVTDPPPYPGYVYSYPEGCWADDVWYAPCPWAPGPTYGYYLYGGGGFVYYPHYRWVYRPGYPPPGHWPHRYYVPARPYHPYYPHHPYGRHR